MTNKVFSSSNEVFIKSCELASVDPTTRQASKYRNWKGKAFHKKGFAVLELDENKEDKKT